MRKIHRLVLLAAFFVMVIATMLMRVPQASATNITWSRVISKWTVGSPWESIKFGVNITDSEVDVLNATLFYSLNATDPESFQKVSMELEEGGDLRNGFWMYTLPGQPNSTYVYYAYSVFFVDGSYDGPNPSLSDPYVWRVYSPQRVFRLNHLRIKSIDPIDLTVDIDCNFIIVWDSDQESITVQISNKIEEYVLSEQRYVNIPATGTRYEYVGTTSIDDLELTGDSSFFPFDHYFLELEFELHGSDKSRIDIQRFTLWQPFSYVWVFSDEKPKLTNQSITTKFYFERRFQNALNILLPLGICWFILGASLMISHERLRARLAIYIALFVFLLNFTGYVRNFVPKKALGVSFAEAAFLYLSLFMGVYVVLSVLGKYFADHFKIKDKNSEKNEDKNKDKKRGFEMKWGLVLLDLAAILFSIIIAFSWPVMQSNTTSKTLMALIPDNRFRLVFLIALSYGLLPNLYSTISNTVKLEAEDFKVIALVSFVWIACIIAFLLPLGTQDMLKVRHTQINPLTYVTASFVHSDLQHLGTNLLGFTLFAFLLHCINRRVNEQRFFLYL